MSSVYKVEFLGWSLALALIVAIHFTGARIGFRKARLMFAFSWLVLFVTKTLTGYLTYQRIGFKPYLLITPGVNLAGFFWTILGQTSTRRFLTLIIRKSDDHPD